MREHDRVVRRQRFELVGRADEGQAGEPRDPLGDPLGELRLGVESGADRSAALRERIELLQAQPRADDPVLHLRRVAGEFLAERQRGRVLGMGAADLDDVRELLALALERALQMRQRRQQAVGDLDRRSDMHRGREAVVRRLAHIDVIVGMHGLLGAPLAAEHFIGAGRDHLVRVHVGLGAGAGLPDHQRKVIVELAVDHLLRGAGDGARAAGIERAEAVVDLGGRALHDAQCADQRNRHALVADPEIAARAFGLRAPQALGGDLDRAEGVGFGAGRARRLSRSSAHDPVRCLRHRSPSARQRPAHGHFLRKRSRLTTWPPPAGVSSASVSFCSVAGFLAGAFLADGWIGRRRIGRRGHRGESEAGRCSAGGRAGLARSSAFRLRRLPLRPASRTAPRTAPTDRRSS